jgi:hypothetical protein
MNEAYFHATLTQIEERAKRLLGEVPVRLDGMDVLAESCRRELEKVICGATFLRDEPRYRHKAVQTEKLRLLRNLFGQLDIMESTAVAALQRARSEDFRMTRMVGELAAECQFPMPPPVVSCTSQDYFNINTSLRLVQMPLTDGRHLLHLPDLIHEIAHILLAELHNPRATPFKRALQEVKARVLAHFHQRAADLALGPSPIGLVSRLPVWKQSWLNAWAVEFFCDLFAVYAVGPAYGWAHLHLCLRQPSEAYNCPSFAETSHPANAARTAAIVDGLRLAGFSSEADELQNAWKELVGITGEKPEADFGECYPPQLIRQAVEFSLKGFREIGCQVMPLIEMGKSQALLNEAWQRFRTDPSKYPAWENTAMNNYFSSYHL